MPEGREEISKKRKLNIPVKISTSEIEIQSDTENKSRHDIIETTSKGIDSSSTKDDSEKTRSQTPSDRLSPDATVPEPPNKVMLLSKYFI